MLHLKVGVKVRVQEEDCTITLSWMCNVKNKWGIDLIIMECSIWQKADGKVHEDSNHLSPLFPHSLLYLRIVSVKFSWFDLKQTLRDRFLYMRLKLATADGGGLLDEGRHLFWSNLMVCLLLPISCYGHTVTLKGLEGLAIIWHLSCLPK